MHTGFAQTGLSPRNQGATDPVVPHDCQVAELASVVAAAKAAYDERQARLTQRLERLRECDQEIAAAVAERDTLEGRRTDLVVEKKRLANRWAGAVCEGLAGTCALRGRC
jgi:hypothetical protein